MGVRVSISPEEPRPLSLFSPVFNYPVIFNNVTRTPHIHHPKQNLDNNLLLTKLSSPLVHSPASLSEVTIKPNPVFKFPFKVFDFIKVFHAVCNLLGLFSFTVILLSHSSITAGLGFFWLYNMPLPCWWAPGLWLQVRGIVNILLCTLLCVSFCNMLKNFSWVYPWE